MALVSYGFLTGMIADGEASSLRKADREDTKQKGSSRRESDSGDHLEVGGSFRANYFRISS